MNYFLSLFFSLIIFVSCGENKPKQPFEDCPKGAPTAIFSNDNAALISQSFQLNEASSLEQVQFQNGLELELLQKGCEEVYQEFQFKIEPAPQNSDIQYWVGKTVDTFKFLSQLGDQYAPFFLWATTIEQMKDSFALNMASEIGPGFFVTINKVESTDHSILIVTLKSSPS